MPRDGLGLIGAFCATFLSVLFAGCQTDEFCEPVGRNREERLWISPWDLVVCTRLLPPSAWDREANKVPVSARTTALLANSLNEFRYENAVRAEHPTFRALCGLLNRVGDWSSLVLLEHLHSSREPPDLPDEYGFVLLVETPSGFQAFTNASRNDEHHDYWFGIRRLKVDPAKARRFLVRMELVHSRLPEAYVDPGGYDWPTLAIHYLAKGRQWTGAVYGYSLGVLLGERAPHAPDEEIVRVMRRPRPATDPHGQEWSRGLSEDAIWQSSFQNVVLSEAQGELLHGIMNRYTQIGAEMLEAAQPWPVMMQRYRERTDSAYPSSAGIP